MAARTRPLRARGNHDPAQRAPRRHRQPLVPPPDCIRRDQPMALCPLRELPRIARPRPIRRVANMSLVAADSRAMAHAAPRSLSGFTQVPGTSHITPERPVTHHSRTNTRTNTSGGSDSGSDYGSSTGSGTAHLEHPAVKTLAPATTTAPGGASTAAEVGRRGRGRRTPRQVVGRGWAAGGRERTTTRDNQ